MAEKGATNTKRTIRLKKVGSQLSEGIAGIRAAADSEKDALGAAMQACWNFLTNAEDRPAKFDEGGHLPLARVYESGNICLARYLGVSEMVGERVVCQFTFSRAGEIQVAENADHGFLVAAINVGLEDADQDIVLELKST